MLFFIVKNLPNATWHKYEPIMLPFYPKNSRLVFIAYKDPDLKTFFQKQISYVKLHNKAIGMTYSFEI